MKQELFWILKRRSVRRYQAREVPRPVIDLLLTAAHWAPSAHNRQPWRFAVITSHALKQRLAMAMGRKLQTDLESDRVDPDLIEKDVRRSYQRITAAPVLILLCLSMEEMDSYRDCRRQQNEWIMAVQSTAMAGQNLLLAAHALNLGACWMCAPLFCPEVVLECLDLPNTWQPQGLITLGYPAAQNQRDREPLSTRVKFVD